VVARPLVAPPAVVLPPGRTAAVALPWPHCFEARTAAQASQRDRAPSWSPRPAAARDRPGPPSPRSHWRA